MAQCAYHTLEGHRQEMADDRAPLYTEAALRRQQGVTRHLRTHRALAQDKVEQDGAHRFAPRALYPPDGDPTQADTDVMGVACQTPASLTVALVGELKADGQEKG
jgi:hypothetical protein